MTGDERHWDAVVIGAGHGGLTCAAYLAAGGMRVLVLEQSKIAGGSTQVFRRYGRYEFDVGTHYLGDAGPDGLVQTVYRGLGAGDRITFRELDPAGFDRIALPSVTVDVPRGWDAYGRRLVAAMPDEADGLREYVGICAALHGRLYAGRFQHNGAVPPRDGDGTGPRHGGVASADPSGERQRVARWRTATLNRVMDHCGLSTRARTVLAAQNANYALGPEQVSAVAHAAMLGDYLLGAYYPQGGGQMLAATLVEVIEANGGQLRTRAAVDAVTVGRGRATGVRMADGTVVTAPVVVSNADYRRTMLDLVGAEHLPASVVSRVRRISMALPLVTLYLAVEADALDVPDANLWWYESEDVNAIYRELAAGELREPRFAFISSGTARGALGDAEPSHHTIEVLTVAPPEHPGLAVDDAAAISYAYRQDPDYLVEKERIGEMLLTMAERAFGTRFRHRLLHREVATPATQTRYTLASGGTPYGIAATPSQFGPLRPDHDSPLPGLYLVGSSTRNGFGIGGVMLGGIRCAELVLRRSLLPEARGGAVLGTPWRLPDRPPGWDPRDACRDTRARHRVSPRVAVRAA